MQQRAAVVGAGAAGLCAARHLLSRPDRFAPPALFERADGVGGTWCYEERVGTRADGRPVHSSMYRDLRTNLPKEVMMFPDFPFDSDLSSFLPHQEVRRYLQRYSDHYGVQRHVRFGAAVEAVEPVVTATEGGGESTTWEVTWSDASGRRGTETFDCVFVCTGHYSDPHIPHIPGIENFRGQVLHSHAYRSPEAFSGRAVLVLGARASGLDISMELATAGAQVTLSHAYPPLRCPLPPGIRQRCPLVAVEDDGAVRFQDGSVGVAEVLLFCTGYNYSYPFLDASRLGLEVRDRLVAPLYLHLLPPEFPSLFFIGVCSQICPFPHFDCQVRFCVAVLLGSAPLPPRSVMAAAARGELAARRGRGLSRRHLLRLDGDQWEYGAALAAAAGFPPPPPALRSLYEEAGLQRRLRPQQYRRINYRLLGPDQWERLEPPDLEPLDPQDLLEPPDLEPLDQDQLDQDQDPLDPQDLLEPPDLDQLEPQDQDPPDPKDQDPQDLDPLDPQDLLEPPDLVPLDP